MKKYICILVSILMLIPFGIVSFAANDGVSAADLQAGATAPNTTCADGISAQSTGTATISGKVIVSFTFNGDGKAILNQNGNEVMSVDIASDGSYSLTGVPAGDYDLVISVSGWTTYTMKDVNIAEGDNVVVYDNTIYAGDANCDGIISVEDISSVLLDGNYGLATTSAVNSSADVDHDGQVTVGDIAVILLDANFAKSSLSSYFINNGWSSYY